MADHTANPLQLQWARQPDGRFAIQVLATFLGPEGELRGITIRSWVLTKEEEESLTKALHGGLLVASVVPGNGREGA